MTENRDIMRTKNKFLNEMEQKLSEKRTQSATKVILHSRENKWGKSTSLFHLGFVKPEYVGLCIQLRMGL